MASLVYAIPLGRLHSLSQGATIVEMLNVLIALNLFRDELAAKSVVIHCDNLAVVLTLNSGRAWDEYLITASYDIDLTVVHILRIV